MMLLAKPISASLGYKNSNPIDNTELFDKNRSLRRPVAQPGSALPWGGRGRWFKSSRADHLIQGANQSHRLL